MIGRFFSIFITRKIVGSIAFGVYNGLRMKDLRSCYFIRNGGLL